MLVVQAQQLHLLQFPASQEPHCEYCWLDEKIDVQGKGKDERVRDKNEARYIAPVKAWTLRYGLRPEVLRLRPITSALASGVSNSRPKKRVAKRTRLPAEPRQASKSTALGYLVSVF